LVVVVITHSWITIILSDITLLHNVSCWVRRRRRRRSLIFLLGSSIPWRLFVCIRGRGNYCCGTIVAFQAWRVVKIATHKRCIVGVAWWT
jgi:hypothetical protein